MTSVSENLIVQGKTCLVHQAQVDGPLKIPQKVFGKLYMPLAETLSKTGEDFEGLPNIGSSTHVNPKCMAYEGFHVPLFIT